MDFLTTNAVVIGLLTVGGIAAVASATGACKKSKAKTITKGGKSTGATGYSETEITKSKKTTDKKSEKNQKKVAQQKAIDDLVAATAKNVPVVVAEVPVVAPKAKVEEKKKADKKTPKPESDEKQAEIDRLTKLLEAVEKQNNPSQKKKVTPVPAEVYNPAPVLTKEAMEQQRIEEAYWASQNGEWTQVKKNERKKEKTAAPVEDETAPVSYDSIIELPIAADKRGLIVGREGATLKRICEASGAKIEMPKNGAVSNKIIIEGTAEQTKTAETAIKDLINKGFSSIIDPELTEGRVRVEQSKRTAVLGTSGENIKKITAATGVKINFPDRTSTSDSVQLVGDAAGVQAAKAAIKAIINEGFSSITHEGWIKINVPFPKSYRPSLIGTRGSLIKSIQANTSCKIDIPSTDEDLVYIVGPATKVYTAAAQVNRVQEKLDTPVPDVYEDGFDDETALAREEEW